MTAVTTQPATAPAADSILTSFVADLGVRTAQLGNVQWVALKDLCERFGIRYRTQYERLREQAVTWATNIVFAVQSPVGRPPQIRMFAIETLKVADWLRTVNVDNLNGNGKILVADLFNRLGSTTNPVNMPQAPAVSSNDALTAAVANLVSLTENIRATSVTSSTLAATITDFNNKLTELSAEQTRQGNFARELDRRLVELQHGNGRNSFRNELSYVQDRLAADIRAVSSNNSELDREIRSLKQFVERGLAALGGAAGPNVHSKTVDTIRKSDVSGFVTFMFDNNLLPPATNGSNVLRSFYLNMFMSVLGHVPERRTITRHETLLDTLSTAELLACFNWLHDYHKQAIVGLHLRPDAGAQAAQLPSTPEALVQAAAETQALNEPVHVNVVPEQPVESFEHTLAEDDNANMAADVSNAEYEVRR